jgi:hypothetical protein
MPCYDNIGVTMKNFVKARDLSHIKVRGDVHLWRVLDGHTKSLTNSPRLKRIEELSVFSADKFFAQMKSLSGELRDGFYFAIHSSKQGNFIPGTEWSEEIESQLRERQIIS